MPGFGHIGKILILTGLLFVIAGLIFVFGSKYLPLGRLPGDISIRRGNFSFFFPAATCIVISLLLSLLLNIFFRR